MNDSPSLDFIPIGTEFSGTYAYDTDTPDGRSMDPLAGGYSLTTPLSLTFDNQTFTFERPYIELPNPYVYRVVSSGFALETLVDAKNPAAIRYLTYFALQIVDFSSAGFETNKLTSTPPTSSDQQIIVSILNQGQSRDIGGVIEKLEVIPTAVPEPNVYSLLLLGLGLIGFNVRRNNTL